MTHIETIRVLTQRADADRQTASGYRTDAKVARDEAMAHEKAADEFDLRAMAYEESIDALQALSTMEATA